MKFTGNNVLVTGGSRGVGADIVRVLAGFGLKAWINYRSDDGRALSLKEEVEKAGGSAAIIQFDVTDEDKFKDAISMIADCDGEIGYLVNNAGMTKDRLSVMVKTSEFDEVIDANLKSCFVGCREYLKLMSKKKTGSVVNIASMVGERGNFGQVSYSASKGGMIAMTKSFAAEGAARNVRFNCVAPGFIVTDMTSGLSDEVKSRYMDSIPLKRFGEAKDVAFTVAFLLSDFSRYITGEVLRVNGGMYM